MCGILFADDRGGERIDADLFYNGLLSQKWRGPDNIEYKLFQKRFWLGHNRLSILDDSVMANMPMSNGRYSIIFNGEIYNHLDLREKYALECRTNSDSETILEGFTKYGKQFLLELRGMFSIVILDQINSYWLAIRDCFGIKPMFLYDKNDLIIISSETIAIRNIVGDLDLDEDSIEEWKAFRRPLPGKTFFSDIQEVLPGYMIDSDGCIVKLLDFNRELTKTGIGDNESLNNLFHLELKDSVRIHQLNDFDNVSLLSGGLDSAVILGLSDISTCYTVGLESNNEFEGAMDSANVLNRNLKRIIVTENELIESWEHLMKLRGEPLTVPNEGLIYLVCKSMNRREKVVLTGEGADELLFGYDRIFFWAAQNEEFNIDDFLKYYCYQNINLTNRMRDYIEELAKDKTSIEFLEDFFIEFHLPLLLRRMDFASMAASKEARVPFVDVRMFELMYRLPFEYRFNLKRSKYPIVELAKRLRLKGAIQRKKIGFSATMNNVDKETEYQNFQEYCLKFLKWKK